MEKDIYEYDVVVDTGLTDVGNVNITIEAASDAEAAEKALLAVRRKYMTEYAEQSYKRKRAMSAMITLKNRAMKN
jgi:hypothetical protein